MRAYSIVCMLFVWSAAAQAGSNGIRPPDPFTLDDTLAPTSDAVSNLTPRSSVINSGIRNLVLITFGQSQASNVNPTLYTPTNSSAVDNFNIADGADYPISGRMAGTTDGFSGSTLLGPGNVTARIADTLVTDGKFDRVICVPIAVGGTSISDWTIGHLSAPGIGGRFGVAMRRLASRGITPTASGVTFAALWMQGEADGQLGTSQSAYQSSWATLYAAMQAAGFPSTSRVFVTEETWINGTVYSAIENAQITIPNGTNIFSGGNLDSLGSSDRQADSTHFNDAGAAAATTIIINAMAASGAPF